MTQCNFKTHLWEFICTLKGKSWWNLENNPEGIQQHVAESDWWHMSQPDWSAYVIAYTCWTACVIAYTYEAACVIIYTYADRNLVAYIQLSREISIPTCATIMANTNSSTPIECPSISNWKLKVGFSGFKGFIFKILVMLRKPTQTRICIPDNLIYHKSWHWRLQSCTNSSVETMSPE